MRRLILLYYSGHLTKDGAKQGFSCKIKEEKGDPTIGDVEKQYKSSGNIKTYCSQINFYTQGKVSVFRSCIILSLSCVLRLIVCVIFWCSIGCFIQPHHITKWSFIAYFLLLVQSSILLFWLLPECFDTERFTIFLVKHSSQWWNADFQFIFLFSLT